MIDRFNFYDIYGYFLPGVALLAFFATPLVVLGVDFSAVDWEMLVLSAPFAYLAGHLVQQVAVETIRTEISTETGDEKETANGKKILRYHSDILLDEDAKGLSDAVRTRIVGYARKNLGLSVRGPAGEHDEGRAQARRDLFFICRKRLVDAGVAQYLQQYQGMYSLMLGLAGAASLGGALNLGCSVALAANTRLPAWSSTAAGVVASILVLGLAGSRRDWRQHWRASLWILAAASFLLGLYVVSPTEGAASPALFWAVSVLAFFTARGAYASYRYFQNNYAAGVYRDFVALLDAEKLAAD